MPYHHMMQSHKQKQFIVQYFHMGKIKHFHIGQIQYCQMGQILNFTCDKFKISHVTQAIFSYGKN